jgi:hypothetical protein
VLLLRFHIFPTSSIVQIKLNHWYYQKKLPLSLLSPKQIIELSITSSHVSLVMMTLCSTFLRATREVLDSSVRIIFARFDFIVQLASCGFAGDAPIDKWTNHFYSIQFCEVKCASDSIASTSWSPQKVVKHKTSYQADCYSGNAPDLYPGGTRLESRLEHQ